VGYTQSLAAVDPDVPAQPLTVTLLSGPAGLVVTNGVLAWMPTEAQGPSTNAVQVSVSDGVGSMTNSFSVVVREVNALPSLAGATNATINELVGYMQSLAPADEDVPMQPLTVSLVSGPTGLMVTNGFVVWTPTEVQGPSTNIIRVSVSDGDAHAFYQFSLVVTDSSVLKPVLSNPSNASGGFRFEVGGRAGERVAVQRSLDLRNWVTVSIYNIPAIIEIPTTISNACEYFRAVRIE
jgi:hypothetical protein